MANIFSGILGGGGSSGQSALERIRFQQEMDEYESKRGAYQRGQDVIASQPEFEKVISTMSPELQAQARMFRKFTTLRSMGDQGLAGVSATAATRRGIKADDVKQRLTTSENKKRGLDATTEANLRHQYKVEHPQLTDYQQNLAEFTDLGDGSGEYTPAQIAALQFQGRDKYIDIGTGKQSTIDPDTFFDYKFAEEAMRKGLGDKQTDQYLGFRDTVAASDTFMSNMNRKRGSVQRLHGLSVDENMGWSAIWNIVPTTTEREWKALRDEVVANIGIDELMKMKDSSPTGASGLGQLSDTEMRILSNLMGRLEQADSPEAVQRILIELDAEYARMEKNRKIKLREINRDNRRFEKKYPDSIPQEFRYEIDENYMYLLDDEFTKPGRESPLIKKETDEERDQRLFGD